MPPEDLDWVNHEQVRTAVFQKTVQAIKDNLAGRPPGPRDHAQDDRLFGPLNEAMSRAARKDDFGLAFHLFHECYGLAREYERTTGSELHKGAPAFNVGLAYLGADDFTAATHYFELAQAETRASYGEAGFSIYEFGLFDRTFWRSVGESLKSCPNVAYLGLWSRSFDEAAAKEDWKALCDASKLHYVIATAQRLRYRHLADLGGWDASEGLRPGHWVLAADLARLVETEARRRSTMAADNLMGLLCGGFKSVKLGDLSARIQNWHANVYKVKSPSAYDAQFKAIRAVIEDPREQPAVRVGHAAYLAGVTRNQVAHGVDPSLVLFRDPDAGRFVTDVLFAVCHLKGWTE